MPCPPGAGPRPARRIFRPFKKSRSYLSFLGVRSGRFTIAKPKIPSLHSLESRFGIGPGVCVRRTADQDGIGKTRFAPRVPGAASARRCGRALMRAAGLPPGLDRTKTHHAEGCTPREERIAKKVVFPRRLWPGKLRRASPRLTISFLGVPFSVKDTPKEQISYQAWNFIPGKGRSPHASRPVKLTFLH